MDRKDDPVPLRTAPNLETRGLRSTQPGTPPFRGWVTLEQGHSSLTPRPPVEVSGVSTRDGRCPGRVTLLVFPGTTHQPGRPSSVQDTQRQPSSPTGRKGVVVITLEGTVVEEVVS